MERKKKDSLLFGIRRRPQEKTGQIDAAPSSSTEKLSGLARDIEDAFLPFKASYCTRHNIEDARKSPEMEFAPSGNDEKNTHPFIEEFKRINVLYSKALSKNRFLEEENRLLQMLEEKLNRKEKEIRKMQNTIDQLRREIETGKSEIKNLKESLIEKDQETEAYKNMLQEKKQSRWRKLLGGR